ncbi:MAG: hypothetical protein M4579_007476, partial [Chaenotheca gracillima]
MKRLTKSLLQERERFWSKETALVIFVLATDVLSLLPLLSNAGTGGPGAGKGTQCARLAQEFDFQHLSVGDLLREEAHRPGSIFADFINESIQKSVIIPATLTIRLLKEKMGEKSIQGRGRYLIDGYPRSMEQALMFEEEIQNRTLTVLLDCPEREMLRRLRTRAEASARADDNEDIFTKCFDTFRVESLPVLAHLRETGLVKTVDCSGSVEDVYDLLKPAVEDLIRVADADPE